jgi:hypothetical protein
MAYQLAAIWPIMSIQYLRGGWRRK